MRLRMVLLIEIRSMISLFSVVRNNGERNGLSMGFITTSHSPTDVRPSGDTNRNTTAVVL
jgi:hypothetical protein